MRTLHDDPELRFELLADLGRRRHGRDDAGRATTSGRSSTPDWLRVICDGLPRDDPRVPSVTFLWNGAEWAEREAYDMFGIIFEGNRDLRRIYMPPDYQALPAAQGLPTCADDAARSPGDGRPRHMEQTASSPRPGRLHRPDDAPCGRREQTVAA